MRWTGVHERAAERELAWCFHGSLAGSCVTVLSRPVGQAAQWRGHKGMCTRAGTRLMHLLVGLHPELAGEREVAVAHMPACSGWLTSESLMAQMQSLDIFQVAIIGVALLALTPSTQHCSRHLQAPEILPADHSMHRLDAAQWLSLSSNSCLPLHVILQGCKSQSAQAEHGLGDVGSLCWPDARLGATAASPSSVQRK